MEIMIQRNQEQVVFYQLREFVDLRCRMGKYADWGNVKTPPRGTYMFLVALHWAAYYGSTAIARLLYPMRNQRIGQQKYTALHVAAARGNVNVLAVILSGAFNINVEDAYDRTPLRWALDNDQDAAAAFLRDRGAVTREIEENSKKHPYCPHPPFSVRRSARPNIWTWTPCRDLYFPGTNDNPELWLPCYIGCKLQDIESRIMWMLESGLKPTDILDDWDLTLLHLAAKLEHVPLVNVLIDRGALVHAQDQYGLTPLHVAAKAGKSESINLLLYHGADVNSRCHNGDTPLHIASSPAVANNLLNRGARVSVRNRNGWTPATSLLMQDTWGSNVQACFDTFRAHGWDPLHDNSCYPGPLLGGSLEHAGETSVEIPVTAFQAAISQFRLELATSLAELGANVNATWNGGENSFHRISNRVVSPKQPRIEFAKLLMAHGVDANTRDNKDRTPLHSAIREHMGLEFITFLIDHCGAELNATNKDGHTMLHEAAFWNHSYPARELGKLLVSRGLDLDVNITNDNIQTPLHLVLMCGSKGELNLNFFRFLLCESGADVNVEDEDGWTALHYAAIYRPCYKFWGPETVAALLIRHGARLCARDFKQRTAADIAGSNSSMRSFLSAAENAEKDEVQAPKAPDGQHWAKFGGWSTPRSPGMEDSPVSWQICTKHRIHWEERLWPSLLR
jgi:ankyrin repeat protein